MNIASHRCGDGGTTHSACDCVVARLAKLEARASMLEDVLRSNFVFQHVHTDDIQGEWVEIAEGWACALCEVGMSDRPDFATADAVVHAPTCPLAKPVAT